MVLWLLHPEELPEDPGEMEGYWWKSYPETEHEPDSSKQGDTDENRPQGLNS